jgi:hypothetical protein
MIENKDSLHGLAVRVLTTWLLIAVGLFAAHGAVRAAVQGNIGLALALQVLPFIMRRGWAWWEQLAAMLLSVAVVAVLYALALHFAPGSRPPVQGGKLGVGLYLAAWLVPGALGALYQRVVTGQIRG